MSDCDDFCEHCLGNSTEPCEYADGNAILDALRDGTILNYVMNHNFNYIRLLVDILSNYKDEYKGVYFSMVGFLYYIEIKSGDDRMVLSCYVGNDKLSHCIMFNNVVAFHCASYHKDNCSCHTLVREYFFKKNKSARKIKE